MPEPARVLTTLRQVRDLSPFFALDVGEPDGSRPDESRHDESRHDEGRHDESWHDGDALLSGPALPGAIDRITARYRTTEPRVAASLFFLGYTARLLSPVVAARAVDGAVPDVRPGNLWWRYGTDGLRVRLKEPRVGTGIAESLAPVVDAVRAVAPVAPGLLWGNAASSVAGALRIVARAGTASAEDCVALGRELFAEPPLRGTGEFVPFPGEVAFRRRSCCLYYRLDGGGTCGDCPLPAR
ncbi:(2Fe-2S)-binding protein [Saccharothrix longispora]|uniref:Ferric iron reductase protein FhuF n=1 Tax=Saccharothrix longispora TaxID=33920 RepID=A0ABU1PWY6_9PSEU|nr:(2Fe-2S)-binding protein [Saccharothrix longispora]MDR6594951.1 ferric iron reductase protein FhuF [Saccharothrix longispora]